MLKPLALAALLASSSILAGCGGGEDVAEEITPSMLSAGEAQMLQQRSLVIDSMVNPAP